MRPASPIAVVALGGRFPRAPSPEGAGPETPALESFWALIREARSAAHEVPPGRWVLPPKLALAPPGAGPTPDRVRSARACFLEETPEDLAGFEGLDLPATLLQALDPMFRVGLAAARDAWLGCVHDGLDPRRVDVILGNIALPTETTSALAWDLFGGELRRRTLQGAAGENTRAHVHPLNRFVLGLPAAIIARALGLAGNTFTLDAACASSLFAVAAACETLRAHRSDAVLCGGIGRPDSLYTHMGFSQLGALSPTGRCAPFDRRGDGLVLGEGAGLFVLKRLDDALAAGDRIHGLLRGAGLSNDRDGKLLSPAEEGQLRAMTAAYRQAGWSPASIDLIECHAAGTAVGDATELRSLHALWSAETARPGQCVLGSVKSNVGHLLTGAGAAGMMKALLALETRTLPPTAHFEQGLEALQPSASPFRVLQVAEPWEAPADGRPRRAAVSAFGFGGTNAHLLLEAWQGDAHPPVAPAPPPKDPVVPVAIVGLGGSFGGWAGLGALSERLLGLDDADTPPTPHPWHAAGVDCPGHYLRSIEVALGRFRIPPNEIREMLPQQLLMLLAAAEAFDDAGPPPENDRLRTGAMIGLSLDLSTTQTHARWAALALAHDPQQARPWMDALGTQDPEALADTLADTMGPPLSPDRTMGALGGIVASRIAREFHLGGPCFVLSSEQSSGLSAIDAAVRALRAGEVDCALAGAVDLAGDIRALATSTPSTDARIGEGAGAVVLRRLDDARAAGDQIYAIIEGVGAASAASSEQLEPDPTAFTRAAQAARAEAEAGCDAAIDLGSVGLLDHSRAHLAAPAREALREAWRAPDQDPEHTPLFCTAAGALGESGAASGMAGLLRAVLALHHRALPGEGRGEACACVPWIHDPQTGPRRAVVSAHAVGGHCAQVLLREPEGPEEAPARASACVPASLSRETLLLLSGADRQALARALRSLASKLADQPLTALAREAHARELASPGSFGLALLARDPEEAHRLVTLALSLFEDPTKASDTLERELSLASRGRIATTLAPLGPTGELAFVYPGSGNHFPGMGRWMGLRFPELHETHRDETARLGRLREQLLPELAWGSKLETMNQDPAGLVRAQVALGIATTQLARRFGLFPAHALGYSLGETAALFALGAWRDRATMAKRMRHTDLFTRELAGPCDAARRAFGEEGELRWSMAVVRRSAAALREALAHESRVFLLIVNTPEACVIGGEQAALDRFARAQGLELHPIEGVTTVHCPVVAQVATAYRELHLLPTTPPPGVRFYSGASGEAYVPDTERAADAILAQAIEGVDFPAMVENAWNEGARLFLEIGPGASCTRMIGEILGEREHRAVAMQVAKQDPERTLLRALALLYAHRVAMDLSPLFEPEEAAPDHARKARATPSAPTLTLQVGQPPPQAPRAAPATETARPPEAEAEVEATRLHAQRVPAPWTQPEPRPAPRPAPLAPLADPLLAALRDASTRRAAAHDAFLRSSQQNLRTLAGGFARLAGAAPLPVSTPLAAPAVPVPKAPAAPRAPTILKPPATVPRALDHAQCVAFATGRIGDVLGASFAHVDAHPTRVRLPEGPLMLVDRIPEIDAEPGSMRPGRIITEHSVHAARWYLDAGRIPTGVCVESGQADLFLAAYLGIDTKTRGLAVYRLLDAKVTFHRPLPKVGETLRHEIRILELFEQAGTFFFRFEYDSTVDGAPQLTMRDGLAGFFTAEALAAGEGVKASRLDRAARRPLPALSLPQLAPPLQNEAYDTAALAALRQGDLAAAFGPAFARLPLRAPTRLPGGKLALIDAVTRCDETGGWYGRGLVHATLAIVPDAWFLTCHFVDDPVMPGTLMYESALQALRVFLMRRGWVGEHEAVVFEPIPGVESVLKCRGQVVEGTREVRYEVHLKALELGTHPEAPRAIADVIMLADGRPIVEISDMSLQASGLDAEGLARLWAPPTIYGPEKIRAYAEGKPSEAFGAPYRVFDSGRRIARLPRDPYLFLDRVTQVEGRPFAFEAGARVDAEVAVDPEAWFFRDDGQETMPFAVLLEIALQPCGWLAAYVGSALQSETDLHFRNLGGEGVQHAPIGRDVGLLRTHTELVDLSKSGDTIIQHFRFEVATRTQTFYEGTTYFGFFTGAALQDQVGLRGASLHPLPADLEAPAPFERGGPLPTGKLAMLDALDLLALEGGPHGHGLVQGSKRIDPAEWFFQAHFYQDPVWPGSLGVEAFLHLLRAYGARRFGATRFEVPAGAAAHRWTYRGQVIPDDGEVIVQAAITHVDEAQGTLQADGFLQVDGRLIYEMKGFTLRCS